MRTKVRFWYGCLLTRADERIKTEVGNFDASADGDGISDLCGCREIVIYIPDL